MSREEKLLDAARETTGDGTISDVGVMHPKGFAAAAGGGAGLGSLAGGTATDSSWGSMLGGTGGAAAGMGAVMSARNLPGRICVAISPKDVYILGMEVSGWDLTPIARIDRSRARVKTKGRVMNRVVIIDDEETGERYEMEAPRANPYHTMDLVNVLAGKQEPTGDGLDSEPT